jgi:hypothetical protein
MRYRRGRHPIAKHLHAVLGDDGGLLGDVDRAWMQRWLWEDYVHNEAVSMNHVEVEIVIMKAEPRFRNPHQERGNVRLILSTIKAKGWKRLGSVVGADSAGGGQAECT